MKNVVLFLIALLFTAPAFAQVNYSQPALSPDGRWFAFISDPNGQDDLFMAKPDGSQIQCLSSQPGTEAHPRWSPDGQWILFNIFAEKEDQPSDVFIFNPWTKELKNITQGNYPDGQACDWHPKGKSLLFSAGPFPGINLYSYNLKTQQIRQLTFEDKKICYYASYLPKSKQILYSVFSRAEKGIFQTDLQARHKTKLVDKGEAAGCGPKGNSFVYQKKEADRYQLLTYDMKKEISQPIVEGQFTQGQAPFWSQDGQSIFFHRETNGQKKIYQIDLNTGMEKLIPLSL